MLGCDKTVTLVSRVWQGGSEFYICTVIRGVSWARRSAVSPKAGGDDASGETRVRIPAAAASVFPRVGDYVALGEISGVTKYADLAGKEFFRVLAVADNRSGFISHVAVSGR